MHIDATDLYYRDLNNQIRQAVEAGETEIELTGVNGQRYIADSLRGNLRIDIKGVPGNDLGIFMDGPRIVVNGNAQDSLANTMNDGKIIVRGNAGDVLCYGMRGGRLYVRGDVGYRVGIHMKGFRKQVPVLVAGGSAGNFLGEYMAGGILVLLSLNGNGICQVGDYCGTGMHGGQIYLRGEVDPFLIATEHVGLTPVTEEDMKILQPLITDYCTELDLDPEMVFAVPFQRLAPISTRPFSNKYAT